MLYGVAVIGRKNSSKVLAMLHMENLWSTDPVSGAVKLVREEMAECTVDISEIHEGHVEELDTEGVQ